MPIPPIPAYPMPTPDSLPTGPASWQVDPARAALLVHDLQHYFLAPFPADRSPRRELVTHVAALREAFVLAGAPVAYTAQPGDMTPEDRGLLADFWGPGMSADPADRDIDPVLAPGPDDVVHTKWRPSAFCRTSLLEQLRAEGRDQLVIVGVYGHVGILMSAHDAFSHDVQPFVVADAIADFDEERHHFTLDYTASRCAVVTTTADVLDQLGVQHGAHPGADPGADPGLGVVA